MSGPWDRPSSGEHSEDEWPPEDLRSPGDPWTPSEPWRDPTPAASSGWDDWPAPPPPDEYLTEEPEPPATDLWSESWGDEAAAASPAWSPEPEAPATPSRTDAFGEPRVEPWSADVDPWAAAQPEVSPEPAPPPTIEPPAEVEPRPWEADRSAWTDEAAPPRTGFEGAIAEPETGAAWAAEPEAAEPELAEPELGADQITVDEPTLLDEPEPEPEPEPGEAAAAPETPRWRSWWASGPASWLAPDQDRAEQPAELTAPALTEPEPEPPAGVEPAAALPAAEWRTETFEPAAEPDLVAEPVSETGGAVGAEEAVPAVGEELPAEDVATPAITSAPEREDWAAEFEALPTTIEQPSPEPEIAVEAEGVPAPGESAAEQEPVASATGAPDATETETPEVAAEIEAEPEPEPEPEPPEVAAEIEPAPAPATVAPVWSVADWLGPVDAEPAPADGAEAEAASGVAEREAAAGVAEGAEEHAAELEGAETVEAPPAVVAPAFLEEWASGAPSGAEAEPETAAEAALAAPQEPAWPEEIEGTQVLPTTWTPSRGAEPEAAGDLEPVAGRPRTSFAERVGYEGEPEPTTAEQAVPWLIGVILLLAGMVIVLLALIFAGDASLGGAVVAPSGSASAAAPTASISGTPSAAPSSSAAASAEPTASTAPTPTPLAIPEYGPLEMVYLGRSAPLAHIFLLHRDFTVEADPEVLAQDPDLDVRRLAWSPDGTVGVGLYADLLISVEPGQAKRRLADGISAVTFGDDPATLYAVRVTEDGANDVAAVLRFDFASGDETELASVTYARPEIAAEDPLPEAQFIDEGGPVRLFWMDGGSLRLWVLGAGSWDLDPADGTVSALATDTPVPTLWSPPHGSQRIAAAVDGGTTTLTLQNSDDDVLATTTAAGLVSHVRWSPDGDRVVFTLGRSAPGGGVLQDLFLWDLGDGQAPVQLTSTGAAFSAEWLGTTPLWK